LLIPIKRKFSCEYATRAHNSHINKYYIVTINIIMI